MIINDIILKKQRELNISDSDLLSILDVKDFNSKTFIKREKYGEIFGRLHFSDIETKLVLDDYSKKGKTLNRILSFSIFTILYVVFFSIIFELFLHKNFHGQWVYFHVGIDFLYQLIFIFIALGCAFLFTFISIGSLFLNDINIIKNKKIHFIIVSIISIVSLILITFVFFYNLDLFRKVIEFNYIRLTE